MKDIDKIESDIKKISETLKKEEVEDANKRILKSFNRDYREILILFNELKLLKQDGSVNVSNIKKKYNNLNRKIDSLNRKILNNNSGSRVSSEVAPDVKITAWTVIIFLLGAGGFMGFSLLRDMSVFFSKYFFSSYYILLTFSYSMITLACIAFFLYAAFLYKLKDGKILKLTWFNITLILMLFFFINSVFYIYYNQGQPDLDLVLRNSSNVKEVVGQIKCEGSSKSVVRANEEVFCDIIEPDLAEFVFQVEFTYDSGNKSIVSKINESSFSAPEEVKYILFSINGSSVDEEYFLTVGYPFHFLDEDEYNELSANILSSFLKSISIVFVTIPLIMLALKNLKKE